MIQAAITYRSREKMPPLDLWETQVFYIESEDAAELRDICLQNNWGLEFRACAPWSLESILVAVKLKASED